MRIQDYRSVVGNMSLARMLLGLSLLFVIACESDVQITSPAQDIKADQQVLTDDKAESLDMAIASSDTWYPSSGDAIVSGSTTSQPPAVTSSADNYLWLVHKGNSSTKMYYRKMSTNGQWSSSTRIVGSYTNTQPALVGYGESAWIFHKGANSTKIWWKTVDSDGSQMPPSGDYEIYGSKTSAAPAVAKGFYSGPTLFNKGESSNYIWYRPMTWYNSWGSSTKIPYAYTSTSPAAVKFNGVLYVFHKGAGSSKKIWYRHKDTWNGPWQPSGGDIKLVGSTTSHPPAVAVFNGRLYVVHKGETSNYIYYRSMDTNGNWSSSTRITGDTATSSSPSVTEFNGRLYVFHKGVSSNNIYYRYMVQ